jgi:hypothetical protein
LVCVTARPGRPQDIGSNAAVKSQTAVVVAVEIDASAGIPEKSPR